MSSDPAVVEGWRPRTLAAHHPGCAPARRILEELLLAEDVGCSLPAVSDGGPHRERSFLALPTATRPRLIIPLVGRRASRAAVQRPIGSAGLGRRVGRGAVRTVLRAGLAPYVFTTTGSVVSLPAAADAGGGLLGTLAELLDRDDLAVAVRLGPPRPNRKPVLQVMTPEGATVAYAKLGWNDHTAALVDHEAEVLAWLGRRSFRRVRPPELLHHGRWRGRPLSVVAAATVHARRAGSGPVDHAAVLAELGAVGGPGVDVELADSGYWLAQRGRRAAIGDPADRDDLGEVVDTVEQRFGATRLSFRWCHGDYSRWNMDWDGERLHLWDWERAQPEAPFGVDAVHYHLRQALHAGVVSRLPSGWERARRACRPLLDALGLSEEQRAAVRALALLEVLLRLVAAPGGRDPDTDRSRRVLLRWLTFELGPS